SGFACQRYFQIQLAISIEIAFDHVCDGSRRCFQRLQANELTGCERTVAIAHEYRNFSSVAAVIAGGSDVGNAVAVEIGDCTVNPAAVNPRLEGFVIEQQTLHGPGHNLM